MKKRLPPMAEYIAVGAMCVLFIGMCVLAFGSIIWTQGNARVINYAGIVRGATQKLVKEELRGYPDDALIARLDSIVDELITGEGPNDLNALPDPAYMFNMEQVKREWTKLKEEIVAVRTGAPGDDLYDLSQSYFTLVDETVSLAEAYSEKQVTATVRLIGGASAVFLIFIAAAVIYYIRLAELKKKADVLHRIAFVDALTNVPSRAKCEQVIQDYTDKPSVCENAAVLMFDMNNLKDINENMGHWGGNQILTELAHILQDEIPEGGFMGRYGGDEFLAIIDDAEEETVRSYVSQVQERVNLYNVQRLHDAEKISFAVGGIVDNMRKWTIGAMVIEADRRMYRNKSRMKRVNVV